MTYAYGLAKVFAYTNTHMNKALLELNLHNMPRFIAKHNKLKAQLKADQERYYDELREMRDALMAQAHKQFNNDVEHIEARLFEIIKGLNKKESWLTTDYLRGVAVSYINWLKGTTSNKTTVKGDIVLVIDERKMPAPGHKLYLEAMRLATDYHHYRTKHFASAEIKQVDEMLRSLRAN